MLRPRYSQIKLYKDAEKLLGGKGVAKRVAFKAPEKAKYDTNAGMIAAILEQLGGAYSDKLDAEATDRDRDAARRMRDDYLKPQKDWNVETDGTTPDALRAATMPGALTGNVGATYDPNVKPFPGEDLYDGTDTAQGMAAALGAPSAALGSPLDPGQPYAVGTDEEGDDANWMTPAEHKAFYEDEALRAQAGFDEENPTGMARVDQGDYGVAKPQSFLGQILGSPAPVPEEQKATLAMRDVLGADAIAKRENKEAIARAIAARDEKRAYEKTVADDLVKGKIDVKRTKAPNTQKPDYITYADKDGNKHVIDMNNPKEAEEAISNIESGEWTKPDTTRGKHLSTTNLNEYVDEKGTFIGSWYWDKNNRRMSKMGDSKAVFPLGAQKRSSGQTGAAIMSAANFNKLEDELHEESSALRALNRYAKDVRKGSSGINLLVDKLIGEFKTIFGGTLTAKQYSLLMSKGELQGLLGKFRKDVVGGGVMTEYDAERVLARLGGNVNLLRNPKIAKDLLRSLFSEKLRSYNHKQKRHAFQQTLAHERPKKYTTTFAAYPQEEVDSIMTSVFDPVVEDSTGSGGTTPKYSPEQIEEERNRRKRERLLNPGKANKS